MLIINIEREYYASSFTDEKKKLNKARKSVTKIINEKKRYVTFEMVMRYIFGLKLDKHIDERPLLPINFD